MGNVVVLDKEHKDDEFTNSEDDQIAADNEEIGVIENKIYQLGAAVINGIVIPGRL